MRESKVMLSGVPRIRVLFEPFGRTQTAGELAPTGRITLRGRRRPRVYRTGNSRPIVIMLEANVELQHLRRTMSPITQGLAELAQGLRASDQPAVLLALARMGNTGSAG